MPCVLNFLFYNRKPTDERDGPGERIHAISNSSDPVFMETDKKYKHTYVRTIVS